MGSALSGNFPRHRWRPAHTGSQWTRFRCRTMNRFCLVACVFAATSALAGSGSFELTVAAGQHERNNVPVRVPISLAKIDNEAIKSVTLTRADGQPMPAQWTGPGLTSSAAGEVHF